MDVEIGADSFELGLAAQAGGADPGAVRQVFNLRVMARAEGIARVFPFCDGNDLEPGGEFGGEIFQRMDGQVNASGGEGFFDLLGEHPLGAYFGEGDVGDLVSGGMNNFNFDFMAAGAQKGGNVVSLPECELGAARADAELGRVAVVRNHFSVLSWHGSRRNFLSPLRGLHTVASLSEGLRHGLHSFTGSRLSTGSCSVLCSSKKRVAVRKFISSAVALSANTRSFDCAWRFASLSARLRSG